MDLSRRSQPQMDTSVQEVMSSPVLSCPLELLLPDVAELMARHRVHCILGFGDVTEEDSRMWGLVSDLDVVAAAASDDFAARTVGGISSTDVVTVSPKASLHEVARS